MYTVSSSSAIAAIVVITFTCETQMPPIMANTKDSQGHKEIFLVTSRRILSQEMFMCNMKALIFIILGDMNNGFFKLVKCQGERVWYQQKDYSCEIKKTLC